MGAPGSGLSLAVLTAAGSSRRMGGAKKEYAEAGGESVLSKSLRCLLDAGVVAVAVTVPEGGEDGARAALDGGLLHRIGIEIIFRAGGKTRRESVLRGLEALEALSSGDSDIVLIHDAARPWAGAELARSVMEAAKSKGAAVPLVPTVDTLKEIDSSGRISAHLKRSRVMAVQTPQGFIFRRILAAHRSIAALVTSGKADDVFTDDAEIWNAAGMGEVAWVDGDVNNRKITFPEDLPGGGGE
jgi:2-C-methyl-D-erythritol 4-phosphate cytidylyltransferase